MLTFKKDTITLEFMQKISELFNRNKVNYDIEFDETNITIFY